MPDESRPKEEKLPMLDNEIKINQFLFRYCQMLVAEIPDERMTEQPLPGVNHPAWILGHLAYSANVAVGLLGGEKTLPSDWLELFKPGSAVRPSRGDYAPKADLLRAVEEHFQRARGFATSASAELLSGPNANPRMKELLPTIQDAAAFLLTGHFGVHLGQLSAWRRMVGMTPLF
jgi:hypothetical protein